MATEYLKNHTCQFCDVATKVAKWSTRKVNQIGLQAEKWD
jgi:hypothetical protein